MKRILSVDDEPAILKCFQRALGRQGYDMITTNDPAEALKIIREQDVDLVMLDIRMPKINGFDIYQELKNQKKDKVPVLFVTAYPSSFSVQSEPLVQLWKQEFADGNTDILYKPFELETLIEKVDGLIGPSGEARK